MEETNLASGGSNPLAFLDAKAPAESVDDLSPSPAPEPSSDRARGADGKFIGKAETDAPAPSPEPIVAPVDAQPAPAVQPAPAATPAPATPVQPEPGHVPISAMLDEREKRQAAERALAALQAKQAAEPAPQRPDATADPEAARKFDQNEMEMRLFAQNREFSRRFAVKEYGAETVAKVQEWAGARCDTDKAFNAKLLASDDPYELSVQEWKREQLLATVKPDDLDDYLAWRAAKDAGTLTPAHPAPAPATTVAPPAPVSPPPPRSLVNAPSAGGADHTPSGPGRAFDTLFSRKG